MTRSPRSTWALGALAVFFFALLAVTGFGLLFGYRPAVEHAYLDVVDLRAASALGFLRGLHHWGSHALVIVVWLHLLRVFLAGAYKPPRRAHWHLGVLLLVATLALATTGTLLPWDQNGYWAVASRQPTPSSGAPAGVALDGATLRWAFALHCGLLPAVTVALVVVHLRRLRGDGEAPISAGEPVDDGAGDAAPGGAAGS